MKIRCAVVGQALSGIHDHRAAEGIIAFCPTMAEGFRIAGLLNDVKPDRQDEYAIYYVKPWPIEGVVIEEEAHRE